jgi:hypothetical protein
MWGEGKKGDDYFLLGPYSSRRIQPSRVALIVRVVTGAPCTVIPSGVARARLLWRHCSQRVRCAKPTWMLHGEGNDNKANKTQSHKRRPTWCLGYR